MHGRVELALQVHPLVDESPALMDLPAEAARYAREPDLEGAANGIRKQEGDIVRGMRGVR